MVLAGLFAFRPVYQGGVMKNLNCPKGHGSMGLKTIKKKITFKGVDLEFETEAYVCSVCGLEAGTVATAGAT